MIYQTLKAKIEKAKEFLGKIKPKLCTIIRHPIIKTAGILLFLALIIIIYTNALPVDKVFRKVENWSLQFQKKSRIEESAKAPEKYVSHISYEQAIIDTVASASPSVVSIVISKNVPVFEQQFINPFGDIPGLNIQIPQNVQKGTKYQEVGAGSGFIVSEDGMIVTNKHVVIDKKADYTVITTDGKKYLAKVLALDPVQDLAIIKIEKALVLNQEIRKFPAVTLGDSDSIVIGQGAVAIGNALGEFKNTVSVGIISGLQRTVDASGSGGFSEVLEGVIQTDAAINPGNSGGPLLNLKGEVIGVNTAMANGAQTIGFAIPINVAKRDIEQLKKSDKIVYPFLGVRYVGIDEAVRDQYKLLVDQGAYIVSDNNQPAIIPDSGADKAGLREKDVVLEVNGEKITSDNSMAKIIQKYHPQDKVILKILRQAEEMKIEVTLGDRS